jgi:hypothetical protein
MRTIARAHGLHCPTTFGGGDVVDLLRLHIHCQCVPICLLFKKNAHMRPHEHVMHLQPPVAPETDARMNSPLQAASCRRECALESQAEGDT